MKFVAIDYYAVKELISSRKLQSSDYEEAERLVNFIKNGDDFELAGLLRGVNSESGAFIISPARDVERILVFDTTNFNGFTKSHQEVISILQKTARLALKLWSKIGFSPCERLIHGTTYIALIPLQFTPGKSYKVLLDKRPDSRRQEIRGNEHFLVFSDGYGTSELSPSLAALREAEKEYLKIQHEDLFDTGESETDQGNYIKISNTPPSTQGSVSPFMGMNFWKDNLTASQKDFVFSDRLGPDILKGAAGTGKTLSLALRCIYQLEKAKINKQNMKSVFFTHSIATKNHIETLISSNGGADFLVPEKPQSVTVTTLQEWCIENLGARISSTEYLDKDALESKNMQLLYINESYEEFLAIDFDTSKSFISDELKQFFDRNDPWTISIHLQNEISTYIKGRAGEDFETYQKLPRSENTIPLKKEQDYSVIFHIFNNYQEKLISLNLFDSDDITISALQETSTPIWKRRRIKDGYDVLYIDETHLFNVNELSLFHNLLKKDNTNIVFTIDRSQATGDSSVHSSDVINAINVGGIERADHGFRTVFRCSSQIINLGSCILASGATLFSQLENPLDGVNGGFTIEDEKKCITPYVISASNNTDMIEKAIKEVDKISKNLQVPNSQVLIIPSDDLALEQIKSKVIENGGLINSIEQRGDYEVVEKASKENSYLIGSMDYIGGLEFPAVVLVGIDKDRFPPKSSNNGESSHFIKYASFNRLYVAVTRAKYIVSFISDKSKGISDILSNSIEENLLETIKEN